MKKIISIIFILIGLGLVGFSIYKYTRPKVGDSVYKEYRTEYILKTYNTDTKEQYHFPVPKGIEMYCSFSDSFMGSCYGNHFGLDVTLHTYVLNFEDFATSEVSTAKNSKYFISIEEVDCIDNAKCYIETRKSSIDDNSKISNLTILVSVSNREAIRARYSFYNGNAKNHLDYILKNIKVTNDASYTIGEEKDGKLHFHLKSDINDNPNAYIDLYLDKDKYEEIPYKSTDIDNARIKTRDGRGFRIYITSNRFVNTNNKGKYYYVFKDLSTVFSLRYSEDKPEAKEKELNSYKITKKGDRTIYEETAQYLNKGIFGIESPTEDVMLVVDLDNEKDTDIIDDLINYSYKFNR